MWQQYNQYKKEPEYLFKFLSFENLEGFLKSGGVWFSSAAEFGDKMECVHVKDLRSGKYDQVKIQERQRHYLISCWHAGSRESLAMWDTYAETAGRRRTVCLRFKKANLISLINIANKLPPGTVSAFYGRILYKNIVGSNSSKLAQVGIRNSAFRKEYAFRYEREYRFVIKTKLPYVEKGLLYVIGSSEKIAFDILVNPLLDELNYKRTIELVKKTPFKDRLQESSLAKWFFQTSILS